MAESETTEPSRSRPALVVVAGSGRSGGPGEQSKAGQNRAASAQTTFDRHELNLLFNLYGSKVAAGEWRDYALDFLPARAVFSVFQRASEAPLYRIEKAPELARKQGAYAVIAASGLVLRRGHDLARVLRVLDRGLRLVGAE
jgi:Protein of unknown function (DUF2794)